MIRDGLDQPILVGCFVRAVKACALGVDEGGVYRIAQILSDRVGLQRPDYHDRWHNLEGQVKDGHGYYVTPAALEKNFVRITKPKPLEAAQELFSDLKDVPDEKSYVVKSELIFKKRDLKGLPCRILDRLDRRIVFVEFEENINGMSCDGLGKTGHCLAVDCKILEAVSEKKEKQKKGRKK